MKVIENKPVGFQPVTLVLESQGEVDFIGSLIGRTKVTEADKLFGVNVYKMFDVLQKYTKTSAQPTTGNIVFGEK